MTGMSAQVEAFAKILEGGGGDNVSRALDERMCCNGQMCGCQGATIGEYLAYELRAYVQRPAEQGDTAAWMGVDVATMNLAHDCLHHALCDAFKVPSRAMRQAAGETLDPAEQHLADLEENAVLHVQRWLHAAGVL